MSKRATLNSAFKAGKIHKQNRNAHNTWLSAAKAVD